MFASFSSLFKILLCGLLNKHSLCSIHMVEQAPCENGSVTGYAVQVCGCGLVSIFPVENFNSCTLGHRSHIVEQLRNKIVQF